MSGQNALPGFATIESQTEFYEAIVADHWAFVGTLVLPAVGFWVVLVAVVQLAAGAALAAGYDPRLFGLIGLGYFGTFIALGFTRLASFVFGLLGRGRRPRRWSDHES